MKVLFTTVNRKNLVCMDYLAQFEKAFAKVAECEWAGMGHPQFRKGENMSQTVKRVMPDADWVITCGRPPVIVRGRRSYKVAMVTLDLHGNHRLRLGMHGFIDYLNNVGLDAILMPYTQLATSGGKAPKNFDQKIYLKKLKMHILHLPLSINPELFKPSNKPKKYDVAFLASHGSRVYPFRQLIWNKLPALAKEHRWEVIMRGKPQGGSLKRDINKYLEKGYIVGPKYAETLALTKVFIFGLGRYKYPTMKFTEGMACRTCLMTDPPLTAKELHYIPDWNFVNINPKNWERKLVYYVSHDEEREGIARNGYDTVIKYHTNDIRAKQLLTFLEEHR